MCHVHTVHSMIEYNPFYMLLLYHLYDRPRFKGGTYPKCKLQFEQFESILKTLPTKTTRRDVQLSSLHLREGHLTFWYGPP